MGEIAATRPRAVAPWDGGNASAPWSSAAQVIRPSGSSPNACGWTTSATPRDLVAIGALAEFTLSVPQSDPRGPLHRNRQELYSASIRSSQVEAPLRRRRWIAGRERRSRDCSEPETAELPFGEDVDLGIERKVAEGLCGRF